MGSASAILQCSQTCTNRPAKAARKAFQNGVRLAAALVTFVLVSPKMAHGQKPLEAGFPAGIRLMGEARGEAAITALGTRLPEVAAFYGRTPEQLREHLRSDPSLRVHRNGELAYACELSCLCHQPAQAAEADVIAESIGTTDPPPFDTSEAFLLHSRPGASRVIYLDFDGHADTSGSWKAGAASPPFDLDGDPATFNDTERNRIIYIWQRVAEDYAMYDIDVTTELPPADALKKTNSNDPAYGVRVAVGGRSTDWYGPGSGGVAFVGSFDAGNDVPAWVFSV